MRVQDLKAGEEWTNDTNAPVELNPPGIVVKPNGRVLLGEDGTVRLLPPASDEPIIEEQRKRQLEEHLSKLSPEDRAREEQRRAGGASPEGPQQALPEHEPTTAETTGKADSESGAQSSTEASRAARDKNRRANE